MMKDVWTLTYIPKARRKPVNARPQRIQRKRTKGWRMPAGTVYVGRPTVWGNPYDNVDDYRPWIMRRQGKGEYAFMQIELLRGKDLACWCPLDQPCPADVLLAWANGPLQ